MDPKTVNVGLVGAGYVSAHHLRALQAVEGARVLGICDPDRARAQAVAERFGVPRVFGSLAEMTAAIQLDAVHILTPPASHCELTLQALAAGCHVLVEKPMAETEADCRRMMAGADQAGRVLAVNHSSRLDPVVVRAAEWARSGAIGTVLGVDFFRSSDYPPHLGGPRPAPYEKGSYPFQDLGVHGISILETFLGPARSAAIDFRSSGLDLNLLLDEWRAAVECERGAGYLYISWNSRPVRSEIFVHGTRGSIHVDCFLQTCRRTGLLPGPKFLTNVAGALRTSAANLVTVPLNVARFATGRLQGAPGIHLSVRDFYQGLKLGPRPHIEPEEGRRIIAVMEPACREADEWTRQKRAAAFVPLAAAPILVTGASGFLGRRVVARLAAGGGPLRVLVRRPLPEWAGMRNLQVVEGDLGDPAIVDHAIAGVQTVYHVGAAMKGGWPDHLRGTIHGTRNVTDSCLRHGVKRLIYVSSISLLDHAGHRPGARLTEEAPYEPFPERRGSYTRAKLEAERIVLTAVRERALPAVIVRPGQIYGPGAEGTSPAGAIAIGGRWIVIGRGHRRLPLVHVEEVVDALELAGQLPSASGQIFHIVDPGPVTQREYLKRVRPHLPPGVRVHYVPQTVLMGAALLCEGAQRLLKRELPLSRYRIRSARPLDGFDLTRARQELGWAPAAATSGAAAGAEPEKQASAASGR